MKIQKSHQMVPIKNIRKTIYVREALDHDRVEYFRQRIVEMIRLRKDNTDIPTELKDSVRPILVTPAYKVVAGGKLEYFAKVAKPWFEMGDGRHRIEAYELEGFKEVEVTVATFETEAEFIAYAYRANTGGAKPPTQADTAHTVMLLVKRGVTIKGIAETLGLPNSVARNFIEKVKGQLERSKLDEAAKLVLGGKMTLPNACRKVGADQKKVRAILAGRAEKPTDDLAKIQAEISNKSRGLSKRKSELLKKLRDKYEDSDISAPRVRSIVKKVERLQILALRATEEWSLRFETLVKERESDKNGKA